MPVAVVDTFESLEKSKSESWRQAQSIPSLAAINISHSRHHCTLPAGIVRTRKNSLERTIWRQDHQLNIQRPWKLGSEKYRMR